MDGDLVQSASAAQPLKHLFEDDVLEHWRNHCGGYRVPRGDESGGTVHAKERTQRSGIAPSSCELFQDLIAQMLP